MFNLDTWHIGQTDFIATPAQNMSLQFSVEEHKI